MNKLIEKFKNLDKRVQIGVGVGASVVVILVIVLIVGICSKLASEDDTQNGTEIGSELGTEIFGTEIFGTENIDGTEELGTELETEMETEIGTEADTETIITNENGTTSTTHESVGGVDQLTTTTKENGEEVLGEGSSTNPILEIPTSSMTVTTVGITPGTTVYYGVYRVGGMVLTIKDANAYVIYNGTRYDASNGKVSVKLSNELASDAVYFEVGNKGSGQTTFTIQFSNQYGSYANPEKISTLGTYNKDLAKGNDTGYYYKYTAEKSGNIRFYMTGTADSSMNVTNNRNSAVRNFEEDVLTDEQGKQYILLENVIAGDEIIIQICAKPNKRWIYPATTITWTAAYY